MYPTYICYTNQEQVAGHRQTALPPYYSSLFYNTNISDYLYMKSFIHRCPSKLFRKSDFHFIVNCFFRYRMTYGDTRTALLFLPTVAYLPAHFIGLNKTLAVKMAKVLKVGAFRE